MCWRGGDGLLSSVPDAHIIVAHFPEKERFFVFLGSCCLLALSFERKGTHRSPSTEKKRQVEVLSVICFFAVWSATRICDARPQMGEVGAIWIILSHCGTLWNDIEVP